MPKLLKLVALVLLLGWIAGFFYALMNFAEATGDSTFMSWYATFAGSNNFAFAILIGIPVLLVFAPVGLLAEWLFEKGDQIQERVASEDHRRRAPVELPRRAAPEPAPAPLSGEEIEELKAKTREGTERTAAYLADFFGPDGPSEAKPRSRGTRSRRRRRY